MADSQTAAPRSGGLWLATALAVLAMILIAVFAFDTSGPGPAQNTAQNESFVPQTIDQDEPTKTQPQPDSGTGSTSLPAQPVKPDQPQGGNTMQP